MNIKSIWFIFNPIRINYIFTDFKANRSIFFKDASFLPVQNSNETTVGGILSEPLARIGGNVTGIDPNSDLVEKARSHIKNENFKLEYLCSSVEEYAVNNKEKYDAVVASEILEHVSRKEEFLAACVSCLKPGGSFFATTINKTFVANFLGILLAENLVQLLPKGTHQYEKFIKPHKLHRLLGERT
jgi:polyprenyldihydroxybenzoate methyltransferase/3-demethylubiquinol 3-O-methyltransferase